MKHSVYKRGSSKASFVQAVLLIAILVIGFLGYQVLKKGGLSAGLNAFVNMDVQNMRPLQAMADEKKVALQKTFGGFWVNETADSTARVRKYDCLELKENGIIWEVIHWNIRYPDGDSSSVYHVRYGYLNPYGLAADDKDVVCEVRTIRQIYIYGNDTCFGASQVDELWQTRKEDSLLIMNRKRYQPYHGELTVFFPEGMIDLIDKLINNDCRHNFSVATLIKEKLGEYISTISGEKTADSTSIGELLHTYFEPAFIEEVFASIPYYPVLPDSIEVPISLSGKGAVIVALSKGKRAQAGHFESRIFDELESWVIAPTMKDISETTRHLLMSYTIRLPAP